MLFIRNLKPNLNVQRDSRCAKLFVCCFNHFLGSYAIHTDPKSEAILSVSVSVSMFEDEKPRDRSPRVFIIWQVDWVLVILSCFIGHYCFQRVVVVVY